MRAGVAFVAAVAMASSSMAVSATSARQSSCRDPGRAAPVLLVHGMGRSDADFGVGSPNLKEHLTTISGVSVDAFDYSAVNRNWVDEPLIGQALADRIACLGDASAAANGVGKVIVVTHSMGGLAIRRAASLESGDRSASDRLGLVVTLGAPHGGSWLEEAVTLGTTGEVSAWVFKILSEALHSQCGTVAAIPDALWGVCEVVKAPSSEAALAMRPGSRELTDLAPLVAGPVLAVAGQIHLIADIFGREVRLSADIGDILVRKDSADRFGSNAARGGGSLVRECDVNVFALVVSGGWTSCAHGGLLTDLEVLSAVGRAVRTWLSTATTTTTTTRARVDTGPSQFWMPSRNIACGFRMSSAVRCDVLQHDWNAPPKPPDCTYDWGFSFTVSSDVGRFACVSDPAISSTPEVLAYGAVARRGAIECRSEESGITCENLDTRHGFMASRSEYKLF